MSYGLHCRLCENRIYYIKTGSKCALTSEKPNFQNKCESISFDVKLKQVIEEVNIELEQVLQTKLLSYVNFWFYLALGIIIILAGYLYGSLAYDHGVISSIPLTIMGVGLLVFPMAFGPLNKYRSGIKVAYHKKQSLDSILLLYGLTYEVDIVTHKDVNGNKEYEANILFAKINA